MEEMKIDGMEQYLRKSAYYDEYTALKSTEFYELIRAFNIEFLKKKNEMKNKKNKINDNIANHLKSDDNYETQSLIDDYLNALNKETMQIEKTKAKNFEINENKGGALRKEYVIKHDAILNILHDKNFIGTEHFFISDGINVELNIIYYADFIYASRFFYIGNDADVKINIMGMNKHFIENRTFINFNGINANAFENISILSSNGSIRTYTQLNHKKQQNKSDSKVHIALFNNASCSIEGMIKIYENAFNSDAFLDQKALVCSDNAKAFSYPSLEIANNNVRATHSSSIMRVE
ncbi:MAG: SufD family Fe-S cluster assembly protein [Candidatus Anstonellales archaeon]